MRTYFGGRQTNRQVNWRWTVSVADQPSVDAEVAGERWRDALAQLEYAERHGALGADVERLADEVIEARVAMFQSGVKGGWALPAFLQSALERDRQLLEVDPPAWDRAIDSFRAAH